jgi:hypothetical protein
MEYHDDTGYFTQHFYLSVEVKYIQKLADQTKELKKYQQREAVLNLNLVSQTEELGKCQEKEAT